MIGVPSILSVIRKGAALARVLPTLIDKASGKDKTYMSVGVMKDQTLKERNLHVSHTLGYWGNWNT